MVPSASAASVTSRAGTGSARSPSSATASRPTAVASATSLIDTLRSREDKPPSPAVATGLLPVAGVTIASPRLEMMNPQ